MTEEGVLRAMPEQQAAIRRDLALRAEGKLLRTIRAALAAGGTSLSLDAPHRIVREAPA